MYQFRIVFILLFFSCIKQNVKNIKAEYYSVEIIDICGNEPVEVSSPWNSHIIFVCKKVDNPMDTIRVGIRRAADLYSASIGDKARIKIIESKNRIVPCEIIDGNKNEILYKDIPILECIMIQE